MKALGLFKTPLNSRQALRWEKTRAKGKFRFMLVNGSIMWGGFMILFLNAIHLFILHDPAELTYFITSLIVWPLGGLLFGLLTWNKTEASYQYFKSQKELNSLTQA